MKINWRNCHASNFAGEMPFIRISDGYESYCASLSGFDQEEMVEEFVRTYDFSDERLEDLGKDECVKSLRRDMSVDVFTDVPHDH